MRGMQSAVIPPAAARRGLLVIALGSLGVPLDSTVNAAFPAITAAFGLAVADIQWVVIAYVLTYASLLLACGRLSDLFGHRRVFLIGAAWSATAFTICAAAPSFPLLLAARIMQGIGAALVASCGPALATSLYPEQQRPRILAWYTLMFAIGATLGTPLAGALLGPFGWRAVFALRVPIAVAALLLAPLLPAGTSSSGAGRFDIRGALLLAASLACGLGALNRVQAIGASPLPCLLLAVLAIAAAFAFAGQQNRARHPIIDMRLFRLPGFTAVNAASALATLAGFAVLLLVPFLLRETTDLPPFAAGCLLAASPLGTTLGSPLAGRLAARIAPRRLALAGAIANTLGLGGLAFTQAVPSLPFLALAMLIQGIGMGMFQVGYLDIVTATVPRTDRGVAGSLAMLTRMTGTLAGATLLMLVFQLASASFHAGFQAALTVAALLAAAAALLLLQRRIR